MAGGGAARTGSGSSAATIRVGGTGHVDPGEQQAGSAAVQNVSTRTGGVQGGDSVGQWGVWDLPSMQCQLID